MRLLYSRCCSDNADRDRRHVLQDGLLPDLRKRSLQPCRFTTVGPLPFEVTKTGHRHHRHAFVRFPCTQRTRTDGVQELSLSPSERARRRQACSDFYLNQDRPTDCSSSRTSSYAGSNNLCSENQGRWTSTHYYRLFSKLIGIKRHYIVTTSFNTKRNYVLLNTNGALFLANCFGGNSSCEDETTKNRTEKGAAPSVRLPVRIPRGDATGGRASHCPKARS